MSEANRVYSDSEVEAELRNTLSHWYLEAGHICRDYKTSGWRATMLLAGALGHLAEAAYHHPELILNYSALAVRLRTHSADGITRKDFELANQFESVATWQPGRSGEGGGTPGKGSPPYVLE